MGELIFSVRTRVFDIITNIDLQDDKLILFVTCYFLRIYVCSYHNKIVCFPLWVIIVAMYANAHYTTRRSRVRRGVFKNTLYAVLWEIKMTMKQRNKAKYTSKSNK